MCIHPDCDAGRRCYATKEQWIKHQDLHRVSNKGFMSIVCPFCLAEVDKTWTNNDRYMHVLSHMERIGLLALPPSGLISKDNDDLAYFDSSASSVSGDSPAQSAPRVGNSEFVARLKDLTPTRYDYISNRWLPDEEGGTPPKSVCTTTHKQSRFLISLFTGTYP